MDENIASDIIKSNTIAFAKQILSNIFPNAIDGFKKVKRRIINSQPIDKRFGGQALIANTIKIHPYGDASIYDAACRLVDSFRHAFPLIEIEGNSGSYSGDKAAHARYTEFWLSDFCKAILFDDINFKTIPTELTEDLKGHEIKYFIPKIPTALLYSNESIGFGYSSLTIPLKFENICNLVINYVSCKNKLSWDYSKVANLFLPSFSIHVFIKNEKDVLNAYTHGNFTYPIETEGLYKIISQNTVLVRTLSYGTSPKMVNERIINYLKDKNSWLSKNECNFLTLSEDKNYIDFQITIKRGVSVFELIERLKKVMMIRSSVHPSNNYVFDEKMYNLNPPDLLRMWYKERYRSIFSSKKHRQQELQSLKLRLDTYLIVCEHSDETISIIRNGGDTDAVVSKLKERFDLSQRQCEILLASNLQLLLRSKRDELEVRIAKVLKDITELNESFKNIDEEIIDDVNKLKRRFKSDLRFSSRKSSFIGFVIVEKQGIVQISNIDELIDIGRIFQSTTIRYFEYPKSIKEVQLNRPSANPTVYKNIQSLPYTTDHQSVLISSTLPNVFIRDGNRSVCIQSSVGSSRSIFNFVSSNPKVVTNSGKIIDATDDLFDTRKYSSEALYAFDLVKDHDKYIVISFNKAHQNVIRFQKVSIDEDVMFSGAGETSVLAVIPDNIDVVVVNMPSFSKYNIFILNDVIKYASKDKVNDITIRNFEKL